MLRDKLDYLLSDKKQIHVYQQTSNGWHFPENNNIYTLFVVMRNPYYRLVSGFIDKYKINGQFRNLWPKDLPCSFSNFVDELIKKNTNVIDALHFFPQTDSSDAFQYPNLITSSFKEVKVMDLNNIDYHYLEKKFDSKITEGAINFKGLHTHDLTVKNNTVKMESSILKEEITELPIESFYPSNETISYHKFYTTELEKGKNIFCYRF